MDDQDAWKGWLAAVTRMLASLGPAERHAWKLTADRVRSHKERLSELTAAPGAAALCSACRGACCAGGKHHLTPLDLLVSLAAGNPPLTPRFHDLPCPYLDRSGCRMAPEFRPFPCLSFVCEAIDGRFSTAQQALIQQAEAELLEIYRELAAVHGDWLTRGLFLAPVSPLPTRLFPPGGSHERCP